MNFRFKAKKREHIDISQLFCDKWLLFFNQNLNDGRENLSLLYCFRLPQFRINRRLWIIVKRNLPNCKYCTYTVCNFLASSFRIGGFSSYIVKPFGHSYSWPFLLNSVINKRSYMRNTNFRLFAGYLKRWHALCRMLELCS